MSTLESPTLAAGLGNLPSPLTFSDAAVAKLRELLAEEGNPAPALRVFVQGGGCSGFQYGFTFDDSVNEDDFRLPLAEADGHGPAVVALLDSMSLPYLQGASIDYREDVNGAQFVVANPNATSTCGCGSSFTA